MYRCKSAGRRNQPESISTKFPMFRGSNPLVATKAKGMKLAKQTKEKRKVLKPKAKKQTKEKGNE